ncbi:MAG: tetratricopeptide repeat protein, partial [Thermoanaerobaculia bacterium]|nr:tetratricopeptide repeat protein [Thermoanaerobaculia bacterium]
RGEVEGARARCREALEIRRPVLGDEHPDVLALAADLERCRAPNGRR